jgi:hypothetical protein
LRCQSLDQTVDSLAVLNHLRNQPSGEVGGCRVGAALGKMSLKNGRRGPLAKFGFE